VSATPPYGPPAQLIAGDSLDFLVRVPSDLAGWTGAARLVGRSAIEATTVAIYAGTSALQVYFNAAATGKLLPGSYQVIVTVSSGADRQTIGTYRLDVSADLTAALDGSALQHAEKMLTLVEAALEARLSGASDGGMEEYEVAGRRITKISTPDLKRLRAQYRGEVYTLRNPDRPIARVKVQFAAAGNVPENLRRRYS